MEFDQATKAIAGEIIRLSQQLDSRMETWRDIALRKQDDETYKFSTGFITKESENKGVELVADIQVESENHKAFLRTWGIEAIEDEDAIPRFNNIQLTYEIEYSEGEKATKRNDAITHAEIAVILQQPATKLHEIIISDLTGRDVKSRQFLGKRYEFSEDEVRTMSDTSRKEILEVLQRVVSRIIKSAESESK